MKKGSHTSGSAEKKRSPWLLLLAAAALAEESRVCWQTSTWPRSGRGCRPTLSCSLCWSGFRSRVRRSRSCTSSSRF